MNPAGSELAYSTFLGGSDGDCVFFVCAIAVDGEGSAYVTGNTSSRDFPTTPGAFDTNYNGGAYDAYVAKLNPAGSDLEYATFLGGREQDYGNGIALNGTGSAFITGQTGSSDFPTTPGAFDTSHNGDFDVFVVELNPAGSQLEYSTFLGGSDSDTGLPITLDGTSSAIVTGLTMSTDFPTTPGAFDTSFNGGLNDAFVAKLSPEGSELEYSTFLGGSGGDHGEGIAVDGAGSAYVIGDTFSTDFPTTPGAFDTSYNGGIDDAFVAKLLLGDFFLRHDPDELDICAPADAVYEIRVGSENGYSDPVSLIAMGVPAGATSDFDLNPVTPPGISMFTISNTGAAAAGTYDIDVTGDSSSGTHTTTMTLNLYTRTPGRPLLLTPPIGAMNQPLQPTFTWQAALQARTYTIEIALDRQFTQIVDTASGLVATSYTPAIVLDLNTRYFWRVRAENACGTGRYSAVFRFRTGSA